jgi:hypothetical protein
MHPEQAPPGFWTWPGDGPALIAGVELDSAVPTRFFQTLDAFPPAWGRLSWRVQLNKLVADRAESPSFRTFYPGVEWNLRSGGRWFLSAWFRWDGDGPRYAGRDLPGAIRVEGDTALFRYAWMPAAESPELPDLERPLFLRSRVDARDRRRIAEALRSEREPAPQPEPGLIVLDDILGPHG